MIGTSATIRSGSYLRIIRETLPHARVTACACPLFVPLVENGYIEENNPGDRIGDAGLSVRFCQSKTGHPGLCCTHYPLIAPLIGQIMGSGTVLIDPGRETARLVKEYLSAHGLQADEGEGQTRYFVSAVTEDFDAIAARFLVIPGTPGGTCGRRRSVPVERISIEKRRYDYHKGHPIR